MFLQSDGHAENDMGAVRILRHSFEEKPTIRQS